ncbi:MAG: MFS transporter permease [Rhodoferax sp.]|nr:MFS transporter permease [Actinomycetota bacterium]
MTRFSRWLFEPAPLSRVALLRIAVYAFVVVDVLALHTSGWYHGFADPVWYQPLQAGRLLGLPAAGVVLVEVLKWGSVGAALVAMTGRLPRTAGWAVALTWSWYQYVAFSYGKVDHDRGDFVVALLLLPTVGIAHLRDNRRSQAAGFALRAVQLGAIATYLLSGVAKLRFGGPGWVNSATLLRAVVRRGSPIGEVFAQVPFMLHAMQWVLMAAELTSWVIFFLPERWRRLMVLAWYLFHAVTYATITIAFWPHLVMLLAFLPLERYRDRVAARWRARRVPATAP